MSSSLRILIILGLLASVAAGIAIERHVLSGHGSAATDTDPDIEHARKHLDPTYVCPMHAEIVAGEPGDCPICGMDLVKREAPAEQHVEDDGRPTVSISPTVVNNLGVKTVAVTRGTLVRKIETPGFIQQITKEKYSRYNAPAKGRIIKFHATGGQWLESGDPIVDIELDDLVSVQERHLELLAKESETSEADAETEETGETATGQTTEFTRALMLRAGMTEAQIAALEQTGATSPMITMVASHSGQVLERRISEDDEVKSNGFLFALGGLMRATVLANAFQRDASWVKPGQPVDIILPHDSQKPWRGVVSQGAVSINTTSQNIGVKLTFAAPKDVLKPGMYVVGHIYGQVRNNTLIVPRGAVIYSGSERRVVLALGGGRFKPVPVTIGITTESGVEILDGLSEGDDVVVSAQFLIDSESSLQASFRRLGE